MCISRPKNKSKPNNAAADKPALAAGDSQLILEDVKVPEYYNQLKEFLRSPDNIAKVMSYSPLSIKETILADIPSKLTKQMINCFKLVLEYAGDIQPTTNPPSSPETGTSIIKAIADVLYTSARDEVVLQIVKQYTECPSNQKALIYLDLLIGILTFMKVSIPEVSKFMSEFIANEKAKSQDIFMKKKFSYLESCVAAVNLASTFNPECNSFGWAIEHVGNSFFDATIEEQMNFQKTRYDYQIPWVLYQLLTAISSAEGENMNSILREATDRKEVTELRISLDKFQTIPISNTDVRVYVFLLLRYLTQSELIPPVQFAKFADALAKKSSDEEILEIFEELPDPNKKSLIYLIYMFKMKILANSSLQSTKTAQMLLSSSIFSTSKIQGVDGPRTATANVEKYTKCMHIFFNNLDLSSAENFT